MQFNLHYKNYACGYKDYYTLPNGTFRVSPHTIAWHKDWIVSSRCASMHTCPLLCVFFPSNQIVALKLSLKGREQLCGVCRCI